MATLADLLRLNDGQQAYTGYPQMQVGMTKPRQAGYATGFLEGATGMDSMQPKNPITDPNYDQYAQGKNTGEIAGIGAMAVPAYAMALRAGAPKAYNALENYMVKSGGMIPLEAYHGTPHKIQGQFDINKVGTGEGAQAYGHGMYFAENPAVAKEYQKMLAGPEQTAAEYLKMYKTPEQAISVLQGNITPNLTAEAKKFSQDAIDVLKSGKELKGNLYKVDIPDADIPNMLNWDKPLSQQPASVQNWLKDPYNAYKEKLIAKDVGGNEPTGNLIYNRLQELMSEGKKSDVFANQANLGALNASKELADYGITGVRYLDEGSRGMRHKVQVFNKNNELETENLFPTEDMAKQYIAQREKQGFKANLSEVDKKRTSNFVVFDPSTVKILEENGKPLTRKELIQEKINKID